MSIPDLLYFSLCFLNLEVMTSQISRFIFDHLCNGWQWRKESKVCLQKCEYLENENFLDQKSIIFKGLPFRGILIIIKKDIVDRRLKAHCLIWCTFVIFIFLWKTKTLVLGTVQSNFLVVQMFNHKIALGNFKH